MKIFKQLAIFAKIDNIEAPLLPNSEWSLTQEEEEEVKVTFISQTDEDFGVIRSSNIFVRTHKHPNHSHIWKTSLFLYCFLLKWDSHYLPRFCVSGNNLKYFQKMLQIMSLLFPVVNIEKWFKSEKLLQIDGFMQFWALAIYFFQTMIKIMLLQAPVMKILQLFVISLVVR